MSQRKQDTSFSKLMGVINKIGTTILMNLCFLVACIPIVTIPAAWSGLYSAIRFNIRDEGWFDGFKRGFKTRFWRNMILWIIGLALAVYFGLELFPIIDTIINEGFIWYYDVFALAVPGLFLLLVLTFLTVMIPVNLYIPTDVTRWITNTWYVVFHAPIQSLISAVLMWLPVVLLVAFLDILYLTLMIFVAAYFAVVAVGMTILLKGGLIKLLERERAENPNFDDTRAEDLED